MAGGLSSGAVGRFEALGDGDEVAAFLRAPAGRLDDDVAPAIEAA
jgi:hypothetical protein